MKATGIVRKIDPLGRIVLPKELRDKLHLITDDPIEIFTDDDRIILQAYRPDHTDIADRLSRIIDDMASEQHPKEELIEALRHIKDAILGQVDAPL
jgi:AbrB family looped-hinge helix DNA binding protein